MKNKYITLVKIKLGEPQTKIYINEMLSTIAFKVMVKAKTLMKVKKIISAYTLRKFVFYCNTNLVFENGHRDFVLSEHKLS
jgi:hypothetical protein